MNDIEVIEMDGEKLIVAQEVWERMAISRAQFYRWAKKENLPSFRIGRIARYKWSEVESALERTRQEASTAGQ